MIIFLSSRLLQDVLHFLVLVGLCFSLNFLSVMCVKIGVTVILGAILFKVQMRMVSWRRTMMVTW
jgi:hypothetical protein